MCLENENLYKKIGLDKIYWQKHITFIGLLSCYIDEKNPHIPVLAEKEEIDKNLEKMTVDDFVKWVVSLQTREQYLSGGHINAIYFEKLQRFFQDAGFSFIEEQKPTVSHIKDIKKFESNNNRSKYSIFVEIKK